MKKFFLGVAATLLALATSAVSGRDISESSLVDTEWRFVEFRSMDDAIGTKRPSVPARYTMRFHGDGTVTMQLDCNRATGIWTAKPGSDRKSGNFEFGPLATTSMHCPPPSMGEEIARQGRFVRSYLLEDDRLYLSLMADAGVFVWESAGRSRNSEEVPASPEHGGPRNWKVTVRLNLREQPAVSARIVSKYEPGTILDNLGCQQSAGRVWCDVQQLGGGPRGFVAAEYLDPAVSPDGSVARGVDDSALRAGQGKFDAAGMIPCALSPGQPMAQCEFGVARAGGGYATVVVKRPAGPSRAIYFRMGIPIGANTSQAEGYPEFRATREGDLNRINIGSERYEIPDAVILGG
ncbi:META domain-containing protein [Microbulbifer aggregans]|uniref:META domain-containing protein n=1 Tax=Microbulbifer aggregans TaxID=1769779 RepID=UPI001CFC556D|nr:META domain-containing protein [Microbulbifer aggregans]